MTTKTFIDKTKWPDGPWLNEPDKAQWIDESTGLDCLAVRASGLHWCGYVGVPETHPLFGKEEDAAYDAVSDLSVHGGLTFTGLCQENRDHGICHVPEPGRPDKVWWLGFDCAHSGDLTGFPRKNGAMELNMLRSWPEQYRTLEYVKTECANLARQVASIAGWHNPLTR